MNGDVGVESARFRIFRRKDAGEYGAMEEVIDSSDVVAQGLQDFYGSGGGEGVEVKVLFAGAGFSLIYAWFKSGFPLARHIHDHDCLYYIVSGTVRVGSEELEAGDGFFVGAGVPYTHTAGEEGLEVLEFRHTEAFTTKFLGAPAYWTKALATIAERREQWAVERRPGNTMVSA